MVRNTPLLLVVLGQQQVCEKRVARHLGVARRRVRLATEAECLASSGFVPGTVPPFGGYSCNCGCRRHLQAACGHGSSGTVLLT
jgi:prolyl-tRNA editing enzyme YbaK/EbsC (Cys-tRNA(Pro) deacylase)